MRSGERLVQVIPLGRHRYAQAERGHVTGTAVVSSRPVLMARFPCTTSRDVKHGSGSAVTATFIECSIWSAASGPAATVSCR